MTKYYLLTESNDLSQNIGVLSVNIENTSGTVSKSEFKKQILPNLKKAIHEHYPDSKVHTVEFTIANNITLETDVIVEMDEDNEATVRDFSLVEVAVYDYK